jgi:hypothetical protein
MERNKIAEIITQTHKTPLEQADEILLLFGVSNQRELLIDCIRTLHGDEIININHLRWIDEYLKTIN